MPARAGGRTWTSRVGAPAGALRNKRKPFGAFFLGGAEDSGSVLYYMCICFKGFGREVVEAKDATRVGGVVRSPASLTIQHMIGQLVEVKRVEDGAVFFSASAATICMTLRARSTSGTSFSARVMELLYL